MQLKGTSAWTSEGERVRSGCGNPLLAPMWTSPATCSSILGGGRELAVDGRRKPALQAITGSRKSWRKLRESGQKECKN